MSDFSLSQIYSPANGAPAADIVFVHGLGDTFQGCWNSNKNIKADPWPLWLRDRFPGLAIWGLQYPTAKISSIFGGVDFSLLAVSASSAEYLRAKKIGKRPVIFVCHSLGGVIVKEILRKCQSSAEQNKKSIFENCCGVVFFATPHSGTSLATIFSKIPLLASTQVKELSKANETLLNSNEWYKNSAPSTGIRTAAFRELKTTNGVIVVDGGSADPGVPKCDCIPLNAVHIEICKFDTEDCLGFVSTVNFLVFNLAPNDIFYEIHTKTFSANQNPIYFQRIFVATDDCALMY